MKKFIETIKNIFKIEELRTRLVYTFGLILVYRLGCFVVLPGIDATLLAKFQDTANQGLVGLLNMFSGGAFGNASIFALGVMPYISASIVIQLLGVFVPYFRKLQMEGESGRKKMNQLTRYLTIGIICRLVTAYKSHGYAPPSSITAKMQKNEAKAATDRSSTSMTDPRKIKATPIAAKSAQRVIFFVL